MIPAITYPTILTIFTPTDRGKAQKEGRRGECQESSRGYQGSSRFQGRESHQQLQRKSLLLLDLGEEQVPKRRQFHGAIQAANEGEEIHRRITK